jgi:hypothetical protein
MFWSDNFDCDFFVNEICWYGEVKTSFTTGTSLYGCMEVGSEVRLQWPTEEQGVMGTVLAVEGDLGLALLRLSRIFQEADHHKRKIVVSLSDGSRSPNYFQLEPFKPSWWLPDWGHEELRHVQ